MHGNTIPEGDPVLLINGSASRDERFFPDADRFDIDRERKVGYNLNFGYGIHSCLGAALARMEGRMALQTLLDLIPRYEIDRAGLQRVHVTNVLGWCNVPVRATTSGPDCPVAAAYPARKPKTIAGPIVPPAPP